MNVFRRATAAMVIAVGLAASAGLATPASAWGDRTRCPHPPSFHTNRYDPFAGHHMDVFTGMCLTAGTRTVPPHLIWVRKPTIAFPTRNILAGPIEDLEVVVPPYVTNVTRLRGAHRHHVSIFGETVDHQGRQPDVRLQGSSHDARLTDLLRWRRLRYSEALVISISGGPSCKTRQLCSSGASSARS